MIDQEETAETKIARIDARLTALDEAASICDKQANLYANEAVATLSGPHDPAAMREYFTLTAQARVARECADTIRLLKKNR